MYIIYLQYELFVHIIFCHIMSYNFKIFLTLSFHIWYDTIAKIFLKLTVNKLFFIKNPFCFFSI